jgi:2-isopropylmalate synthase
VAYVLDRDHGLDLPKTMHHQVGSAIYNHADRLGRELSSDEIRDYFYAHFVNLREPFALLDFDLQHHASGKPGEVRCTATIQTHGETLTIQGTGNGPINAFVHALDSVQLKHFNVTDYRSHAVQGGSDADSAAFVQLRKADSDQLVWGCGIDPSIEMAGLRALVSAMNLLV